MMKNSILGINKLGLIIGSVGLLICIIFGTWWILQPAWQPVLNSIDSPHSRLEIRNKLMEWGTVFKEDPSTGNILVKDTELLALRAKLGAQGIPEEPAPGLEIFNNAEYGMSEFTQRINYQRAIEAEIANTIRSFADVNSARVHLTIPKQSIFRDEKAIPKASVTIKPRPQQELNSNQINGIAQLVAASVDGLDAKNVIILNNRGEVISSSQDDLKSEIRQSTFNLESYYASKASELVRGIANTDDIKISVNIIYNFDKVKSIREQIIPKPSGEHGHLQKVKRNTVKNNNSNTSDSSTTTSTEEEFLFSKERSEIEYSPGEIEKLSVGIVVLRELPQQTIDSIIKVVGSGLGIDVNRGDTIAVVAMNIDKLPEKESDVKREQSDNTIIKKDANSIVKATIFEQNKIIIGLLIMMLIVALTAIYKRKKQHFNYPRLSKQEQEAMVLELKAWLSKTS